MRKLLILTGIFCGLYAPFELTRVLILMEAGYNVVTPWYIWWEVAAIWLGYIVMVCCLLIYKRGKVEK